VCGAKVDQRRICRRNHCRILEQHIPGERRPHGGQQPGRQCADGQPEVKIAKGARETAEHDSRDRPEGDPGCGQWVCKPNFLPTLSVYMWSCKDRIPPFPPLELYISHTKPRINMCTYRDLFSPTPIYTRIIRLILNCIFL